MPPTAGYVSWRLPKTVIDAAVTFKYKDCRMPVGGEPEIELERTVALVTRGVPDDDIFGKAKPFDPMVRVPISALTSFISALGITRVVIAHRSETIASAKRRFVLAEGILREI